MAIPPTAVVWEEPMDPYDVVDYTIDCTPLLSSEGIASFTIVPLAESELLGLEIGTGEYAPVESDSVITVWLQVDPTFQANPAFSGPGVTLPVELSLTTNSSPPRKRQRTVVVKVAQR